MMKRIPILTFHSIDTSGSVISISPSQFTYFLTVLKQKGYHIISLNDVIQWLAGKKIFHSPCVVITFDDGFENLYHNAFPVLEELGFQATLFLTTGHCGKKNDWPSQHPSIPLLPMLTWKQIEEMATTVFDIQAHTQTHPFLFKLDTEQANEELLGSKSEIENRLGKPVNFFAYPYGYFDKGEDVLIRQFFQGACSTSLAFVSPTSDRHLLPRIDMYYLSHQTTSRFFLSNMFVPYIQFRQFFRTLRQSLK